MMKIWMLFLLPICLGFLSTTHFIPQRQTLTSNSIGNDTILWNPNRKLTWNDFQGKIDSTMSYKAITSTHMKIKPIISTQDVVTYDMMCLFEKNKSWTKNRESQRLLQHEQLHFDIAELAMRSMRKKVLEYGYKNGDSISVMIKIIFDETIGEMKLINKKYDLETKHSVVLKEQKKWELYIASELKKKEKYASTRVVIKLQE